jgi:hypothetical protein
MATFTGTREEFNRYIGPRLKNVVNYMTKKHKETVAACEHCGSAGPLEAAHVAGRERAEIIDLLLGENSPGDQLEVDLQEFEDAFKFEHEPIEKSILALCRPCHQKYDSQTPRTPRRAASNSTGDASPRPRAADKLPITLDPPRVEDFKVRLLERKAAQLTVFYSDGRTEARQWDASRFSETSNVFGNLRSRPDFRQGKWQTAGIVKVHVRV